jgi:hypothetical protein
MARPRCVAGGASGLERVRHRVPRARDVALQLPRVRDAGVRLETGLRVDHPLKRLERLPVAPELQLRVADDAVYVGVVWVDPRRAPSVSERGGEIMAGGLERASRDVGLEVLVVLDPQRPLEHAVRLRVIAGIGRDPRLLHVGRAERGERAPVARALAHALLQSGDRRGQRARRDRRADDASGAGHQRARGRVHVARPSAQQPDPRDDEHRRGHDEDGADPQGSAHRRTLRHESIFPVLRPDAQEAGWRASRRPRAHALPIVRSGSRAARGRITACDAVIAGPRAVAPPRWTTSATPARSPNTSSRSRP